ncbi:hypothetical protein [Streptomyces cinereoruber]|uniref:hypothetical protein n=1 Tax=Streptomyces cinereoruber TaxID=67260 RepID=UPI00363AC78E
MIIDRNADVTPNRYKSPLLRRTIGKRLGHADRDDMLRALLWVSEVRMASDLADAWREFHRQLDRETTEAQNRRDRQIWEVSDQVGESARAAAKDLAEKLWPERYEAREALEECERVAEKFGSRLGMDHGDELPGLRTVLAVMSDQLELANERLSELMSKDKEELHELAQLEQRRREPEAGGGVTLEQLDKMEQAEFDLVIQGALERSGFQVTSSEPAVLEATDSAGGAGLVICLNSQNPARDEKTNVEQIAKAQRLAEEHGAVSVLLISNLRYLSHPAYRLLEGLKSKVHLI